jgi:hypothetical protein
MRKRIFIAKKATLTLCFFISSKFFARNQTFLLSKFPEMFSRVCLCHRVVAKAVGAESQKKTI